MHNAAYVVGYADAVTWTALQTLYAGSISHGATYKAKREFA